MFSAYIILYQKMSNPFVFNTWNKTVQVEVEWLQGGIAMGTPVAAELHPSFP